MTITLLVKVKGGPGSGNYGHAGRPGMVGGSGGHGGSGMAVTTADAAMRKLHALPQGTEIGREDDPIGTLFPFEEENRTYGMHMGDLEGTKRIPISQLHSNRPNLERSGVARYVGDGGKRAQTGKPIKVVRRGDAYYILDGNHRAAASKLLGYDTIRAEVWSYESG